MQWTWIFNILYIVLLQFSSPFVVVMDGNNGFNIRNWGYYKPATSFGSHPGLQFMSSMPENPILGGRNVVVSSATNNGAFTHNIGIPQATYPMDMRNAWMNSQREKFMNLVPSNSSNGGIPGTSVTPQRMQMIQPPQLAKEKRPMEEAPMVEKAKELEIRGPSMPKDERNSSTQRAPKVPKKTAEVVINGILVDISSIPTPVCSCTGIPRQCYKWGSSGWQSACCTTAMSMYPLPMNTKRRGARISGRKMTMGVFKKILTKFAAEGYNFSNPIDLKTYWSKHGTNKFITIK